MTPNTFTLNLYAQKAWQRQLRDVSTRIDYLTQLFIGKPYLSAPQGEGENSAIDQAPLYRFDGFDCVTFVNNILALALSDNLPSFQKKLLQINYYDAKPLFENRFHFMSADWNPQNQKNNRVVDVTKKIVDENGKAIAELAEGDIDRPSWFLKQADLCTRQKLPRRLWKRERKRPRSMNGTVTRKDDVFNYTPFQSDCAGASACASIIFVTKFLSCTEQADNKKSDALRAMALKVKKEWVSLPYLPLSTLFDDQKMPRNFLFQQIPSVSVLEIVRPNWNLKEKIGTNLHVSHVGFAIRDVNGELFFRHASSEQKKVMSIRLSDYLSDYLDSPTIKGINVQEINI